MTATTRGRPVLKGVRTRGHFKQGPLLPAHISRKVGGLSGTGRFSTVESGTVAVLGGAFTSTSRSFQPPYTAYLKPNSRHLRSHELGISPEEPAGRMMGVIKRGGEEGMQRLHVEGNDDVQSGWK